MVNGEDVAYQASGTGPVLLLVHGMAGSSTTWARVIPALSERCTVVAPDLLGHGESAKPRGEYSLGSHADVIRVLRDDCREFRLPLRVQRARSGS